MEKISENLVVQELEDEKMFLVTFTEVTKATAKELNENFNNLEASKKQAEENLANLETQKEKIKEGLTKTVSIEGAKITALDAANTKAKLWLAIQEQESHREPKGA